MVLLWEGKDFAAADADTTDAVETNWKHSHPRPGDLMIDYDVSNTIELEIPYFATKTVK